MTEMLTKLAKLLASLLALVLLAPALYLTGKSFAPTIA